MDTTDSNENSSNRSLSRYGAVSFIQTALGSGISLRQAIQAASLKPWNGRYCSFSTLEHWYYAFQKGQFQALKDKPRNDSGQSRSLAPEVLDALLALRRTHPGLTLQSLIRQLLTQGVLLPGKYSYSTLNRALHQAGLDKQSLKAGAGLAPAQGPTKAFEVAFANELWMADSMHGPVLSAPGQKPQRTFLLALIDDCSRLVPHAEYYTKEQIVHFLHTLRQAVQSRGVPLKLYTDNGTFFVSHHLQHVCANLGIRLLHARPYAAFSKGKIERFFQGVQKDFQQRLFFEPAHTLRTLNERFWKWLATDYHHVPRKHLEDQSPADRYLARSKGLRTLDPACDVEALFLTRLKRRVRKDATISLGAQLFEVSPSLRGLEVSVTYDPFTFGRVDIFYQDKFVGKARRCDKVANSKSYDKGDNYERLDR